jgi:hypothetical protein
MCEVTIYFLQTHLGKCVGDQIIVCKIQLGSFLEPNTSTKKQLSTCMEKQIHYMQEAEADVAFRLTLPNSQMGYTT